MRYRRQKKNNPIRSQHCQLCLVKETICLFSWILVLMGIDIDNRRYNQRQEVVGRNCTRRYVRDAHPSSEPEKNKKILLLPSVALGAVKFVRAARLRCHYVLHLFCNTLQFRITNSPVESCDCCKDVRTYTFEGISILSPYLSHCTKQKGMKFVIQAILERYRMADFVA